MTLRISSDDGQGGIKAVSATLMKENLDGTLQVRYEDGSFANVPDTAVEAHRYNQVRLPADVSDRIMHANVDKMKTLTRFYLINKGTVEVPKPALLDQVSLVLALKTLVPTMHMKLCMALSINILTRYFCLPACLPHLRLPRLVLSACRHHTATRGTVTMPT